MRTNGIRRVQRSPNLSWPPPRWSIWMRMAFWKKKLERWRGTGFGSFPYLKRMHSHTHHNTRSLMTSATFHLASNLATLNEEWSRDWDRDPIIGILRLNSTGSIPASASGCLLYSLLQGVKYRCKSDKCDASRTLPHCRANSEVFGT